MPTPPAPLQPLRDSGDSAHKDGPTSPTVPLTAPEDQGLQQHVDQAGRSPEDEKVSDAKVEKVTEQTILERYQAQHVEIFSRWMITMSRGISGRLKILLYDVKVLVQWGGVLTSLLDGTILTFDWNNASFLACLVFSFTVVFLVVQGSVAQEDADTIETEGIVKLAGVMNQVVPFTLSLYLSVGMTRWWHMRQHGLGKLFSAIVNVCMVVSCVLPAERHKPIRTMVVKWSMASVYLLVKATRNQSRVIDMQLKGLLSDSDAAAMEDMDSFSRPMVCWGWVVRICQESLFESNGPMPYSVQYGRICEIAGEARDSIDNISMFLQTQLPFVYVHLITLLVDVNNVLFILKCGVISAVAFMARDWQQLCSEILTCTCVPILYRGLLSISYVIHDPFGEEILDFPVGGYAAYVADCVSDMIKAQERFPGVPEEVYKTTRESIGRQSQMDLRGPATGAPKSAEEIVAGLHAAPLDEPVWQEYCATPTSSRAEADTGMPELPPVSETHPLPKITNAKDAAAAAAAGRAAESIGAELRVFAEVFGAEMQKLIPRAAALRDAIAKESARRDEDVFRLCGLVFHQNGDGDNTAAALAPSHINGSRASQVARDLVRGSSNEPDVNPRASQAGVVAAGGDMEFVEQRNDFDFAPNTRTSQMAANARASQAMADMEYAANLRASQAAAMGDMEYAANLRTSQAVDDMEYIANLRASQAAAMAEIEQIENLRASQVGAIGDMESYVRTSQVGEVDMYEANLRASQAAGDPAGWGAMDYEAYARASQGPEDPAYGAGTETSMYKTPTQVARDIATGADIEIDDGVRASQVARALLRGEDVEFIDNRRASEVETDYARDLVK